MTRKELQELLNKYPEKMQVKYTRDLSGKMSDVTDETVILYSDTVYIDDEAPEDEWDHEDGKVELGDGEQFILINAPVL